MRRTLPIIAAALLLGCSAMDRKADTTSGGHRREVAKAGSLYERLGGRDAIAKVVDDFVANVAADEKINRFFTDVNLPRLKGLLVDQICEASGGPCRYTGRTMRGAHKGMGVTDAHFNALVVDLVAALDSNGVPEKEKQELLGILGPMRADIVARRGAHKGKRKRR
jgi:hemoglobin